MISSEEDPGHTVRTLRRWGLGCIESGFLLIINPQKRQLYYDDDGQGWLGSCNLPEVQNQSFRYI